MTTYARAFAERNRITSDNEIVAGLEMEARVYSALAEVLSTHRLLICPTLAVPALEAGNEYLEHGPPINGVVAPHLREVLMTLPFNICSRCPVMSVPSGLGAEGVPTGLQIVGHTYDDRSVFAAAAAFERLRPWLDAKERRPRL